MPRIFSCLFLFIVFLSCSKKETNNPGPGQTPMVITDSIGGISKTSAKAYFTISNQGSIILLEAGVVWGESPNPTISNNKVVGSDFIKGSYNVGMSKLNAGSPYYFRAYVTNKNGTFYGNEVMFVTQSSPDLPTIELDSIIEVTNNSATVVSTILSTGKSPGMEAGIAWSLNPNPSITDNKITTTSYGVGIFYIAVKGLGKGVTYYVRSYSKTALGISYSAEKSFTTSPFDIPEVSKPTIFNILSNVAFGSFTITSYGGTILSDSGLCWSSSPNPTILNSISKGRENVSINTLNPQTKYYVRAYAINNSGIGYSEQVEFTTKAPPSPLEQAKLFLTNGSRKTWILDIAEGAKPIVAGTESNPVQYYAGGPLADCQKNDEYTFTSTDSMYCNFNADALVFGGPGDYNCNPYQVQGGTTFTFDPVAGSVTGLAQITLANARVGVNVSAGKFFIGVMDNVQNLYRILEISESKMLLRVGDGLNGGAVQTIKFVKK